ncbi:MAG: SDR family NAD(P)-dependent oxidoreductase, partial [Candidatus Puniceispirillaceae bacterium]
MSQSTPRTILITGASRGIGRACALAFALQGNRLFLAARNAEKLAEVAEECMNNGAANVQAIPADLADEGARKACAD